MAAQAILHRIGRRGNYGGAIRRTNPRNPVLRRTYACRGEGHGLLSCMTVMAVGASRMAVLVQQYGLGRIVDARSGRKRMATAAGLSRLHVLGKNIRRSWAHVRVPRMAGYACLFIGAAQDLRLA